MNDFHRVLLAHLQLGLEQRYDVRLPCPIDHFVSHDADWLASMTDASEPVDELLLVRQQADSLDVTLFLEAGILADADTALSSGNLDQRGLDALCTVVEGVSHVVCLLWHACHDRQVRALDLELQADVDKFVLLAHPGNSASDRRALHQLLFDGMRITAPPGSSLHARYRTAHQQAARYCRWLNQTYMDANDEQGLATELARFYRLSGHGKREHIGQFH